LSNSTVTLVAELCYRRRIAMDLDVFRDGLDMWLDRNVHELRPTYTGAGSLAEQVAQMAKVKQMAYDAGWMRWGWPERVGGFGGSNLFRAIFGEAVTERDLWEPGFASLHEVLAPKMIDYAPADLAAAMVPRLLRGDEMWCQGFSEPGTGSNLADLACHARHDGEVWRVSGQKVWTSLAQFATRCVLLTRTGVPGSAYKGITALFVDMDAPGISVRPIEAMHGHHEFCEVFFDDVAVPMERTLGEEGHGWAVAMDILPYERSTALWHRVAYLHHRLLTLVEVAAPGSIDPDDVGEVVQVLSAFRARSCATQRRLAGGGVLGPETSIDKILLGTAEQAVFDLAEQALSTEVLTGDDAGAARWRSEFLYSRAATIYGGSAEIQRNIVARRLLQLGSDR
jgi:alkylation response protein AidB-like acyl-CoA dehydrogenase